MKKKIFEVITNGEKEFRGDIHQVSAYMGITPKAIHKRIEDNRKDLKGRYVRSLDMKIYAIDGNNNIIAKGYTVGDLADRLGYCKQYIQQRIKNKGLVGDEYRIIWETEYAND